MRCRPAKFEPRPEVPPAVVTSAHPVRIMRQLAPNAPLEETQFKYNGYYYGTPLFRDYNEAHAFLREHGKADTRYVLVPAHKS